MAETHTILGGKVHLYKRENSSYWQCATYLASKNRRTSTKEESLSKAKEIAEDWYLQMRGKLRAGEPVTRPEASPQNVVIYRAGLGHAGSTADLGTLQYIDVDPMAYELLESLAKAGRAYPERVEAFGVGEEVKSGVCSRDCDAVGERPVVELSNDRYSAHPRRQARHERVGAEDSRREA